MSFAQRRHIFLLRHILIQHVEKRAAGTRVSHEKAVNRSKLTNRKALLCTHHIPEQEVNIYTNCHQVPDSLPLFKRSSGTSRGVRALVRISHRSAESNTPRDNLNRLLPSLLRCPPPSDRATGNVNDGEKTSGSSDTGGQCCRLLLKLHQTDGLEEGAGPTHNILHPNTTRSSIQHIRGRGEGGGGRGGLSSDHKCHKKKM